MLTTTRNLNLSKLSFDTEADELAFAEELKTLLNRSNTKHFVRSNTVQVLYELYLTLLGEKSVFEIAFYNTIGQYSLLKDYLTQFTDAGYLWTEKPMAIEVFIGLAAKNQEANYLFRFLEAEILTTYQREHLSKLSSYTFEQLITFIELHAQEGEGLSNTEKSFLCELIGLVPVELFENIPTKKLHQFLKEILPIFCEIFYEDLSSASLTLHVSKVADWYQVWLKHQTKSEPEILLLNDDYYQTDFATIIKYVPDLLWWQNGIYFRNEVKKFTFGSPEFLHLARGGSIRQALSTHPLSRPIARVFSKLPYDFDQTGLDVYLYCYFKSLHTGDLLTRLLQDFVGNYSNAERMKIEIDRWRPVIQKLASPDFEELDENRAMELLGYLTHVLRDKPKFTVKKQNLARLLKAAADYYQLIRERAQARERQRLLRDKQRRREEKDRNSWAPSNRVKPLVVGRYKIFELSNREQLRQEGRAMGHCVATYADNCKNGHQSIWSLRELNDDRWKSLVTIALSRNLFIKEARARFNAIPKKEYKLLVQKWAENNKFFKTGVLEEWDL